MLVKQLMSSSRNMYSPLVSIMEIKEGGGIIQNWSLR